MLQWGRDQLIAEFSTTPGPSRVSSRLQWGRDQLIAEFSPTPAPLLADAGLQWGRDQLIAELSWRIAPRPSSIELQWGRDQLIAELADQDVNALITYLASMGPRSIDRGIPVLQNACEEMGLCFNGAAIN